LDEKTRTGSLSDPPADVFSEPESISSSSSDEDDEEDDEDDDDEADDDGEGDGEDATASGEGDGAAVFDESGVDGESAAVDPVPASPTVTCLSVSLSSPMPRQPEKTRADAIMTKISSLKRSFFMICLLCFYLRFVLL
jgi:hypothetical protein